MTPEDVKQQEDHLHELVLQVRNWGKWGPDDELGTLNYITRAIIADAAQLVTDGKVFALVQRFVNTLQVISVPNGPSAADLPLSNEALNLS